MATLTDNSSEPKYGENGIITTAEFWEPLKDKGLYDFRYILTGLTSETTDCAEIENLIRNVAHYINTAEEIDDANLDFATGRGDCIALCEVPEEFYTNLETETARIQGILDGAGTITTSKYTALFAPSITYTDAETRKFAEGEQLDPSKYTVVWYPAAFHYLACAAKARENFAEWFAVSGYPRGFSDYTIAIPKIILGDRATNAVQPRKKYKYKTETVNETQVDKYATCAVNLIVHQPTGYYLWGNRTAYELNTEGLKASHFLNIRQLCTTIKKQLYIACKSFMFDPNSDTLWVNFKAAITPTLEEMKANQGIKNYSIIREIEKDPTKNIRGLLKAKIRIVPIEAVEDFDIGLYLEDQISGADITESEE